MNYVLEITGRPQMVTLAVNVIAPLGTVGLIGSAPAGTQAPVDMLSLAWGRSVRGIVQGDAVPQLFIPQLIEMHRAGRFPFERVVRYYDRSNKLSDEGLDLLFRNARSHNGWLPEPVSDAVLRELYELLKWGPTSANSCSARFVFVKSHEAKEKLLPCMATGNLEKAGNAPVVTIIAQDMEFYEHVHKNQKR